MNNESLHELLFANTKKHNKKYVEKHLDHYLEQYKIYVNIFNYTSERRQKSNEFFLGINAAIIGILGYIEIKSTFSSPIFFLFIPLLGIGVCYSWYQIIASYKQINRAKFRIVHALESHLPAALFETEWEILGRGKDVNKYAPLSNIERSIPLMFITMYVVIIATKLPWKVIINFFQTY